jgi:hypothetical protein
MSVKSYAKVRALGLIDILIAHHGARLSKFHRDLRLARAHNNFTWEHHLMNLYDHAFRQCGRWANERRRVRAFKL